MPLGLVEGTSDWLINGIPMKKLRFKVFFIP